MENNSSPSPLHEFIREKHRNAELEKEKELLARAEQVRILMGIPNAVGVIECPKCGTVLVDPRGKHVADEEDTIG